MKKPTIVLLSGLLVGSGLAMSQTVSSANENNEALKTMETKTTKEHTISNTPIDRIKLDQLLVLKKEKVQKVDSIKKKKIETFKRNEEKRIEAEKRKAAEDAKKAEEQKRAEEAKKAEEEKQQQAQQQQQAAQAQPAQQPVQQRQAAQPAPQANYGNDLRGYVLGRMVAATGVPASTWDMIINRESRWQPTAQNPYSTAHGLFQSLYITSNNVDDQINDAIRLFNNGGMRHWALTNY